jgi:signal transduction histidine kinase
VSDNGTGLPQPVDLERLKAAGHFGVAGMHERARGIGGMLEVRPADGGGTMVAVQLPSAMPVDDPPEAPVQEPPGLVPRVGILGARRVRRSGVRA